MDEVDGEGRNINTTGMAVVKYKYITFALIIKIIHSKGIMPVILYFFFKKSRFRIKLFCCGIQWRRSVTENIFQFVKIIPRGQFGISLFHQICDGTINKVFLMLTVDYPYAIRVSPTQKRRFL